MVMMALVAAGTLNSSAAYLRTAVNGASSGTLSLHSRDARASTGRGSHVRSLTTLRRCCRSVQWVLQAAELYVRASPVDDRHSHAEGQLRVRGERDLEGNLAHRADRTPINTQRGKNVEARPSSALRISGPQVKAQGSSGESYRGLRGHLSLTRIIRPSYSLTVWIRTLLAVLGATV